MTRIPAAVRPLRHRDFRLLWAGLTVSLVESGLWLVALAWQARGLEDEPHGCLRPHLPAGRKGRGRMKSPLENKNDVIS